MQNVYYYLFLLFHPAGVKSGSVQFSSEQQTGWSILPGWLYKTADLSSDLAMLAQLETVFQCQKMWSDVPWIDQLQHLNDLQVLSEHVEVIQAHPREVRDPALLCRDCYLARWDNHPLLSSPKHSCDQTCLDIGHPAKLLSPGLQQTASRPRRYRCSWLPLQLQVALRVQSPCNTPVSGLG